MFNTSLRRVPLLFACALALASPAQAMDAYEPDDSPSRASAFLVGSNQLHTLHSASDEDWVRFFVPPGGVFDIEVEQLGANIDLQVEVYYEGFHGSPTNLDFLAVDDLGKGIGEVEFTGIDLLLVTELEFGFYLVRVYSADTNCFGAGADYSLRIFPPTGATLLAVVAIDTHGTGESPSNTVAIINGAQHYPFNGANTITIPDLDPGVHSVELRTAPGYAITFDPDAPGQDQNPHNPLFGNPRFVTIADGNTPFMPFAFSPIVHVEGRVVDAITGESVRAVPIAFEGTVAPVDGLVVTQQFNGTWYGKLWTTDENGYFPSNLFLERGEYKIQLNASNYVWQAVTNIVGATLPGQTNRQGEISLAPVDSDTNRIADAWEQWHFGGVVAPGADADQDGASNRDEYLAGTDPTNRNSALGFEPVMFSGTNAICISWPVVKGRNYSIDSRPAMSDTNLTVLLDRWVAPSNGVRRFYDNASASLSSRVYRVRIDLP